MKIATVCGMGLGTSMMLAMQIRAILEKEGIKAKVDPIDLGSVKSMGADIVVAPRDMEHQVTGAATHIVLIDNLIDKTEIKTKVLTLFKSIKS